MAINITKQEAIDKIVAEFNLPDPSQEREDGKSFYAKDGDNADFFFDKRQYTRYEVIERLVNLFHGVNILEGQCSIDPITLLWTTARIGDRDKTNPDAA